jgi:hypothetical protein
MSRVPDEPQSWPTEADGDAASRNLRQQIETARQRLGQQWNQMHASEAGRDGDADGGEAHA